MASSKKKSPKTSAPKVPKSLRKGGLPRSVGDVWTAGVGALDQARATGAESFEALVALGAAVVDTGSKATRGALGQVEAAAGRLAGGARGLADDVVGGVGGGVEAVVEEALERLGVPHRDEVAALREQIDGLQSRIETLNRQGQRAATGGRPGRPADSASADKAGAERDEARTESGDNAPTADRAVYRVAPHERGWSVQREGTARAGSVHPTKKEALHEARQTARTHAPSRLVVLKADGSAGGETDYDP